VKKLKNKKFLSFFFLTFVLMLPATSLIQAHAASGKWYYWLKPDAYATYVLTSEESPDIQRYILAPSLSKFNSISLLNETKLMFENIALKWKVIHVEGDWAAVNYTLELFNVTEYQRLEMVCHYDAWLVSTNVRVNLESLEAYTENETLMGRWPFWVRLSEVGSDITIVHNTLKTSLEGTSYLSNVTVRLTDFGKYVRELKGDPSSMSVSTLLGPFCLEELLFFTPIVKPEQPSAGVNVSGNPPAIYVSQGSFPGLYSKSSLIMIAYNGEYIDDVLSHTGIVCNINLNKSLVIGNSNINFYLDEGGNRVTIEWENFILPFCLAVSVGLGGWVLYVRRKKRH